MKKLNILLLGYMVRGPVAGMTWHHLNYFLGLHAMGHNVCFLEDSGDFQECCYNPETNETTPDSAYGLDYAERVFNHFGVPGKWAYWNNHTNSWEGPQANNAMTIIDRADMLINISLVNPVRRWLEKVPVKVAIDTDPLFTQIKNIEDPSFNKVTRSHTHFFTFAENIYQNDCTIPDDGFKWMPTRQPIYLPEWKVAPLKTDGRWTTVFLWESYKSRIYNGKEYGMKSISFRDYLSLPKLVPREEFELAMGNNGPVKEFEAIGWHTINPLIPSIDPWTYRDYISNSIGEWSVAKHGYAITQSGWFSERSACYLASGKPVVVQDTGFSKHLPVGEGLLSFRTLDEAKENLNYARSNYKQNSLKAREIATEFFSSEKVLDNLLSGL